MRIRLPAKATQSFARIPKTVARPPVSDYLGILPPSRRMQRKYGSPKQPWSDVVPDIPSELLSAPGVRRDDEVERSAFEEQPIQNFVALHEESFIWEIGEDWRSILPVSPLLARAEAAAKATWEQEPARSDKATDPVILKTGLQQCAKGLGIGAIGVTHVNPYYTYRQAAGTEAGDRVVVCALEQQHDGTQQIAGLKGNLAGYQSEAECIEAVAKLTHYLHEQGYRARAHTTFLTDLGMAIAFAVEAGLGQMGLNGQLLTPAAGCRVRLGLLTTDAPLPFDGPRDFGIPGICDRCQACVRRCPVGAIPANRKLYRGVEKAKINTARCFPTVAQAHGCGVCMKVCPIQRYGLLAVLDEYKKTKRILGRDTDDLEGYYWPLDDHHYAPGERPRIRPEFFNPPGFNFDPKRRVPVSEQTRTEPTNN